VIARDRGEVHFSQDRPIALAGTNACVHPGCDRMPVDFSIFCGRTHAYAHTRASRALPPPSPPPSPPQSPHPSAANRVDAHSAHSQPAQAPIRFFSSVWHMSHAAWNKLQHALHGNGPPLPTQPPGDPPLPTPAPQPTLVTAAPRPSRAAKNFLHRLAAVAHLLAEYGGTKRCTLPGCDRPVRFDVADPRQRHDYCGKDHANRARVHAADPSPSARPPRPYPAKNNDDFALKPSMRACATCGQRHLDRDCPLVMLSGPGALADVIALAASRRPATPCAAAPLSTAAHTAAVVAACPATPGASAAPAPSARPPRVLIPSMRACIICGQRHLNRNCPSYATAALAAAPAPTLSALRYGIEHTENGWTSPHEIGGAGAASDYWAPLANAHATAAAVTARPATPAVAAAAAHAAAAATGTVAATAPWLPTGDAGPSAPLPAAAAVERRDAHVAWNYEEAVERRDAHVARTYDALSLDGSEYAPHPRQRTSTHTADDDEWFIAARKERSAALFQIDALESRLRLACDHYQDLLRAVTDQQAFIIERDARNNACWTPSPPASPPASPRCPSHDPAHSFPVDLNDDLEVDCNISHGAPSPLPPTWSPLNRLYVSIWHISHKAWNKAMHALHGNGFDISDIFLLVIVAALSYRLTVIGIHLLTACQRATDVFICPAATAATTYSIIDAITRLVTPPSTSRAGPAFDTPPPPQETVTDHHGRDKPAGHRPPRSGRGTSPPVASPSLLRPPRRW